MTAFLEGMGYLLPVRGAAAKRVAYSTRRARCGAQRVQLSLTEIADKGIRGCFQSALDAAARVSPLPRPPVHENPHSWKPGSAVRRHARGAF